jgi:UDP-N-acetylmuramyl pentapeptide phosphotransferase/UDP-N-acetylglucosamine-1-phosphate transferase
MNFNIMQWFDPSILIWLAISLVLNGLIAYFWQKKLYVKFGFKKYQAIQRIHLGEIPRLGGLVFIISLFGYVFFCSPSESILLIKQILSCLVPILVIGLKEDLFYNADPFTRLAALFFVGWFFMANFMGPLPNLNEVPFVRKLFLFQGGATLFFILSMAAIANGMNLIDGVNGLCAAAVFTILAALLFLSYKTADNIMLSLIFSLILLLIPFILFNYPFGRIFLGDLGSYSLGLIVSMFTIILFGRHPEISPWAAVLILIYPLAELIFSMLRRVIKGDSLYSADNAHIHIKLFHFFRSQQAYKKIANALITPVLTGLWIYPLLAITWVYQKPFFIWIAIILYIFFYVSLYWVAHNLQKFK